MQENGLNKNFIESKILDLKSSFFESVQNWDAGFGFSGLTIPRILELFTWVCENCLNCENLIPTNDRFDFKLIDQYRIGTK